MVSPRSPETRCMILRKGISDKEILAGILNGGEAEDTALKFLYETHSGWVKSYSRANRGNEDDGKDLLQSVIIRFFEQVKEGTYRGEASIKSYLRILARNMWINQLKRGELSRKYVDFQRHSESPVTAMAEPSGDRNSELLAEELLNRVGSPCRELLIEYYYRKTLLEDIAVMLGLKNAQNARNKKYKCMEKLRELVENDKTIRSMRRE